jgi:hypothetical protein
MELLDGAVGGVPTVGDERTTSTPPRHHDAADR